MSIEPEMLKRLLKWCAEEKWDWLLALRDPLDPFVDPTEANFWRLMRMIETHDGTWAFKWALFTPMGQMPEDKGDCLALFGGLGSGEWRYWACLWAAFAKDPQLKARKIWSAQDGESIASVLKARLGDVTFQMSMQLGPRRIWRDDRCLEVDEEGIPTDLKLRKKIKRVLRQSPEGRMKYPAKFFDDKPRKWEDVLAWMDPEEPPAKGKGSKKTPK